MANQLRDIRAAVARHCMDWVRFVATEESGAGTVLIDSVAGYENDQHFRGSELWFIDTNGTVNDGLIIRVIDSSMNDYSLSLAPGLLAAPVVGEEAWAYNIGGTGNRIRTYDATINDTIRTLGEMAHPVYSLELVGTWDTDVWWVAIPEEFTHINQVQYQDSTGNWIGVPSHGFEVDFVNKMIALAPEYAAEANGYVARLNGRIAPDLLVDDTDETDLDFEWVTQESAATLLMQSRDQFKVNKGGLLKNNADAIRGKAAPFNLIEGMVRVR